MGRFKRTLRRRVQIQYEVNSEVTGGLEKL